MSSDIRTDFIIIGVGPAGAALAAFLGYNGLSGLAISKDSATAETPRAHTFNPFAFECLRDVGIEDSAWEVALHGKHFQSMRWSRSFVGEEYGRVRGWAEHPSSMGPTAAISPCQYAELPQSMLEPVLIKYASHNGFNIRFSTELIDVKPTKTNDGQREFLCSLFDRVTQQPWQVRARYLFGADGARSQVARSLDFQFDTKPSGNKACNVLIRADLSHLMHKERYAVLHWVLKPDQSTFSGVVAQLRVVRPWKEWVLVVFGPGGTNPFENMTIDDPRIADFAREVIGDSSIDVEVLRLDAWTVRESVAKCYVDSSTQAFILGDAAHRHPPVYGLGSNTCVQDAYNLAWKILYVSKGLAGQGLLETYNAERQPVGASLVRAANDGFQSHAEIWGALGMFAPSPEEGLKHLDQFYHASPEGAERRAIIQNSLQNIEREVQSLGIAHNQWYTSGAVYLHDEQSSRPVLHGDPVVNVQVTTYPGSRLPHAWLDIATRGELRSTHDLAGKGAFCLFFGIGGERWKQAANAVRKATGIPLNAYGVGFGLDYIDVDRDWCRKREVEEAGCVLVRPDRFVAWRSTKMITDCEGKLLDVLNQVLSRTELR
ncbi:unnamed protein product [Clonostachys byssicola]|uniref:FAD-binding domain-containing protein n=1 Tax=Clonostachys byssicola TaxID=160290 RepID=A0A9N9UGK3_9HYPO|nr:unnamed protein product [Clonostachys byssicola]